MNDNRNVVIFEDSEETLHLVIPELPLRMLDDLVVDGQAAGCIGSAISKSA